MALKELHEAGGYMNVPPTELPGMIRDEQNPEKRREMRQALSAWRETQGNPLARSAASVASAWLHRFCAYTAPIQ